ncbi:hypothetical protein SLEP1_g31700 [Rubroshorea leprosula]|uniref:Uncharacterized protein n=1 Tax=Rubroshorea leprosula TaxID=152421 RepID=A0AAV5K8K6_9ROSI|nr:hypothetical protein SLEP1_g31700 [Rubroshorea leprosula]
MEIEEGGEKERGNEKEEAQGSRRWFGSLTEEMVCNEAGKSEKGWREEDDQATIGFQMPKFHT